MLFGETDEAAQPRIQGLSQFVCNFYPNTDLPQLNRAHVGAVDARSLSKLLLRPAKLLPPSPDSEAKGLPAESGAERHPASIGVCSL